jgi:hypothetical protein
MTAASVLIRKALVLGNVIDPEEETPDGYVEAGLDSLNDILSQWSKLGIYIPYVNTVTLSLTADESEYEVSPEIAEFNEGNVLGSDNLLTPLRLIDEYEFNRINVSQASDRPSCIYLSPDQNFLTLDSSVTATLVTVYPTPDAAYTATLMVKQYLQEVTMFQELTEIPRYYERPLRYELASELSDIYETEVSDKFIRKHAQLIKQLEASVPKDFRVNTVNPFLSYRRYRPWGNTYGS